MHLNRKTFSHNSCCVFLICISTSQYIASVLHRNKLVGTLSFKKVRWYFRWTGYVL